MIGLRREDRLGEMVGHVHVQKLAIERPAGRAQVRHYLVEETIATEPEDKSSGGVGLREPSRREDDRQDR